MLLLVGLTALLATAFRPAAAPSTQVFLVGDSTMADKPNPSRPNLLRIAGDRSKAIRPANTDIRKAKRGVALGPKTAKKTMTLATR